MKTLKNNKLTLNKSTIIELMDEVKGKGDEPQYSNGGTFGNTCRSCERQGCPPLRQ